MKSLKQRFPFFPRWTYGEVSKSFSKSGLANMLEMTVSGLLYHTWYDTFCHSGALAERFSSTTVFKHCQGALPDGILSIVFKSSSWFLNGPLNWRSNLCWISRHQRFMSSSISPRDISTFLNRRSASRKATSSSNDPQGFRESRIDSGDAFGRMILPCQSHFSPINKLECWTEGLNCCTSQKWMIIECIRMWQLWMIMKVRYSRWWRDLMIGIWWSRGLHRFMITRPAFGMNARTDMSS